MSFTDQLIAAGITPEEIAEAQLENARRRAVSLKLAEWNRQLYEEAREKWIPKVEAIWVEEGIGWAIWTAGQMSATSDPMGRVVLHDWISRICEKLRNGT